MKLTQLFSPDVCVTELVATDCPSALDALVDLLVAHGKVSPADRETIRQAIRQREQRASTGVGAGIALPHASVACVTNPVAVMARLAPALDWRATDGQAIWLCILFVTPAGQAAQHLQVLSSLARFCASPSAREGLRSARSAEEMFAALRLG
jgi:mannitol/fructose-specific phosphotransferase system IIA component (Ntr-type)